MKHIFALPALIAGFFIAASCDSSRYSPSADDGLPDPSDPSMIDIYSVKTYSTEEFCDFVGESFDDYLSDYLWKETDFIVKDIVEGVFDDNAAVTDSIVADEIGCLRLFARSKWGVKVYNYAYCSISHTGNSIKLSAALCVPYLLDEDETHTLSAMSLCPPHMPIDKEYCATRNGTILMARTAFNHAVVVPDYQGRGITSSGPYSSLHTHDHALQTIHAALAARTILEQEGFEFSDDFALYNIGVSEGDETAYETQKIIENDISKEWRDKLNLKLSFCANGITRHSLYVESQMKIYEYVDEESHKLQMDFYKDAFDNFTEAEKQGWKGEDLYSPDLLDKDGKIIIDHPLIKVLEEGVSRNDIPYNWNPGHPLTLAASTDDNDVLFAEHTLYAYELLKNSPDGTPNGNVQLMSFTTPLSKMISDYLGPDMMFAHVGADICGFVHCIKFEDPGAEAITIPWAD